MLQYLAKRMGPTTHAKYVRYWIRKKIEQSSRWLHQSLGKRLGHVRYLRKCAWLRSCKNHCWSFIYGQVKSWRNKRFKGDHFARNSCLTQYLWLHMSWLLLTWRCSKTSCWLWNFLRRQRLIKDLRYLREHCFRRPNFPKHNRLWIHAFFAIHKLGSAWCSHTGWRICQRVLSWKSQRSEAHL